MNKKFLGLSGKWWAVVLLMGVLVFWYVKRKGGNTAAQSTNTANTSDDLGVDEGQLASDIGAQVAASLGGTPGDESGGFDASWLADLMQQNEQSLEDFIANQSAIAGSGVTAVGGSAAPTVPSSGGSAGTNAPTSLVTATSGGITQTVTPSGAIDLGTILPNGTTATAADPGTVAALSPTPPNPNEPIYATVSPSTSQTIYQTAPPKPLPGNATAV